MIVKLEALNIYRIEPETEAEQFLVGQLFNSFLTSKVTVKVVGNGGELTLTGGKDDLGDKIKAYFPI